MTFEDFALDRRVLAGVRQMGYETPTPIQKQAILPVMEGRDVLGLAQTGTGKTAAFVLPILQRLLDGPRGVTRALIVAPTRELAEQIHQDIRGLAVGTRLRSATVYGGVGMTPQTRALKGGAEIIVACPGRLLDHMQRGNADLRRLEVLVLDEADHMFDMGFLPSIRRILKAVPDGAQRLLFSATMPSELRHLANDVLGDPVTVEVGRRAPAATVSHALYPVLKQDKTALLQHLLKEHDPRSVLVFTRTKHGAKKLAAQLDRDNHFVTSLQGNLSQSRRQKALDGFRDGSYHILVATDIAARGIDVSRVTHVVNYDMPGTVDAYTHRIGRTGRAERTGLAMTFMTPDDVKMVRAIEGAMGQKIDRVHVEAFASRVPEAAQDTPRGRPGRPPRGSGRAQGPRSEGDRGGAGRGGASTKGRDATGDASRAQPRGDGSGSSSGNGRRRNRRRGRRGGQTESRSDQAGSGDRNS